MKTCLLALFGLAASALMGQVPNLVNYQGRVAVGTVNFDGTGQFKFALVNAAGTTSYWSNNGSSTAGSEPTAALTLPVSRGLYQVLLGDTGLAGMSAIPASVWANAEVRLRVWFNDGTNGFQLLTPDQRLAPSGYLPDGSVTEAKVSDGAVTGAKIAAGAVGSAQMAANAVQAGNIATGAVGSTQLATNAVQSGNIAAGAVTNAALANGAVTGAQLATGSRSGTLWDGVVSYPGGSTVSAVFTFSPPLAIAPVLAQSPGGWTLTPDANPVTGFTASRTLSFAAQTVDAAGTVGEHTSLAVIGGNPAISYYDNTNDDLKFARNSAADGSGTWNFVTVDANGSVGRYTSLAVIGGSPAISYWDQTNGDLKFARNSAADGSGIWTTVTVDATGNVGTATSLAVIGGNPAISYRDVTNRGLKFARNSAADGSGIWSIVTVGATGDVGTSTSLAVIGGNPAISYYDTTNGDLKFARNSAADGSGIWTTVTVDATGNVGTDTSLAVIGGNPAISYWDVTNSGLKFARNSAADGSGTWSIVTVDAEGYVGTDTSLAVIGGNPAISYWDQTNGDLKFARNSAADGSGTWSIVTVDAEGYVGGHTSLAVIGGNPAISYLDSDNANLKFASLPALHWTASEFGTAGPITATSFAGSGSGLTNLNGASLTAGSVPSAALADGSIVDADISGSAAISATKLGAGSVDNAELGHLNGVTAPLQTQMDAKAPLASPTFTGTVTAPTFSGALSGNAATATSATSFTGSLAGDVTGTQGATSITAATVTGKALTGFVSGAGTISATDSILTAINKLNGNVAQRAPLASPTFTGTVGIGTSSPLALLDIAPPAGSVDGIRLGNTTDTASRFIGIVGTTPVTFAANSGFSGMELGSPGGSNTGPEGYLAFHTHDSGISSGERMRIDKFGNVGIGTSAPKGALHVNGDYYGSGHLFLHAVQGDGSNGTAFVQARDDSGTSSIGLTLRTQNGGSFVNAASFAANGNLTVVGNAFKPGGGMWSISSDRRLKKDIQPLTGALDRLMELRSVTYEYKDPHVPGYAPGTQTGFIAQEVEPHFPDWVQTGEDGMKILSITGFESLTVQALRELREEKDAEMKKKDAEMKAKDEKIADLEARMAKLERMMLGGAAEKTLVSKKGVQP